MDRLVAPLTGSVDSNKAQYKNYIASLKSLPSRGAWIEIQVLLEVPGLPKSLPSRGAWIEMGGWPSLLPASGTSLPSRGAWIEIGCRCNGYGEQPGSLPSRGAWIEMISSAPGPLRTPSRSPHGERGLKFGDFGQGLLCQQSLPSRGAWIEIFCHPPALVGKTVAPLTGSVD